MEICCLVHPLESELELRKKIELESVCAVDVIEGSTLSLLEAVLLSFVEQICFGATEVDDLWATISLEFEKEENHF